jgi:peptidoglycan/LPS O-acetylase OafA/YrhL
MGKLASLFVNGETAYLLFVLSGFVLSYKYIVLGHSLDFRKYYISRFLRLWPAFFVAVVIHALYHYRHDLSVHNLVSQFLFNETHFWEEALLLHYNPEHNVNPLYVLPGWAVVTQLSVSFFMPFMIALAYRKPTYIVWMIFALILIGTNVGVKHVYHIHYAFGLLCCCYYFSIKDISFKETKWYKYRWLFLSIALVLFSTRQLNRINKVDIFGPTYDHWVKDYMGFSFSLYSAFASFVFLVAIIHSDKVKRLFDNMVLRYIGKVSYSLYLIHWVVVMAIFDNWQYLSGLFPSTIIAMLVTMAACTIVSMLLASLMYYFVELPTARLTRRFVNKLKPSFVISPADN